MYKRQAMSQEGKLLNHWHIQVSPACQVRKLTLKWKKKRGDFEPRRSRRLQNMEPEDLALANLSVNKAVRCYGSVAEEAIAKEFTMLFKEKKALVPIKTNTLTSEQYQGLLRCHMFLKEKRDALGNFEKMKGRLVGDGRTQDRTLYQNLESPTVSVEAVFIKSIIETQLRSAYQLLHNFSVLMPAASNSAWYFPLRWSLSLTPA